MSIDLYEHRGVVYNVLYEKGFPEETREDAFQDFAVYFYGKYKETNKYKISTIIRTYMHNWLTERARVFNNQKSVPPYALEESDKHHEGWLDSKVSALELDLSLLLECEFIWEKISEDLKEYLLYLAVGDTPARTDIKKLSKAAENPVYVIAERDGVTRQGVEKRLKQELEALRNTLNR